MTVAVAWALALWSPLFPRIPSTEVSFLEHGKWSVRAADVWDVAWPNISQWPPAPNARETYRVFGRRAVVQRGFEDNHVFFAGVHESVVSSGWPCLALRTEVAAPSGSGRDFKGPHFSSWHTGLIVDWLSRDDGDFRRSLPLVPECPGLALNAIFWGALAYGFLLTARMCRSRWRRARGRCGRCTYPVHGAVTCPECGAHF